MIIEILVSIGLVSGNIRAVVLSWAETTVRCTNIREAGSTPAPSTTIYERKSVLNPKVGRR